ncbi:MAG: hypothetical protein AAB680_01375 [Pseudomonadota bacterium]
MAVDFQIQRANMIESQVRTNDVSDAKLIAAINKVKRENFVEEASANFAYAEVAVKSKSGRFLLKPRDFAKLAQATMIESGDEVLVIAGSGGYSSAVFNALGAKTTVIDNISIAASENEITIGNIETLAELQDGMFDIIFVDGGVPRIPTSWGEKLKESGRLCVIVMVDGIGHAKIFVKSNGQISGRTIFDTKPPILTELNLSPEFVF